MMRFWRVFIKMYHSSVAQVCWTWLIVASISLMIAACERSPHNGTQSQKKSLSQPVTSAGSVVEGTKESSKVNSPAPAVDSSINRWSGDLDAIKKGISLMQLRAALPRSEDDRGWVPVGLPKHHFTIKQNDRTIMALSANMCSYVWYYFVFEDGLLDRIVAYRKLDTSKFEMENPTNMDDLVAMLTESSGVPFEQFPSRVRQEKEQFTGTIKKLIQKMEPQGGHIESPEEVRHKALMTKYDATQIVLGESTTEVVNRFGEPTGTELVNSETLLTYGESTTLDRGYAVPRVHVTFRDGKAVAIYTMYLRNQDKREHVH
jgi:hypothetical protein